MLSNRRRIFIETYLKTWSAGAAARAATGCKDSSSREVGHRMMQQPEVKEEIARRVEDVCMSTNEALTRLAEQARNPAASYILDDGTIDLAAIRAAGLMHLIKKVKTNRSGGIEVEFCDPQNALVQIGRAHGLFLDRQDVTSDGEKLNVVLYMPQNGRDGDDTSNAG